jgi:hypothetical protein
MLHARSPLGLALLFSLTLLSGCLDYGEELTLNKDGSGRLKLDFTVDMAYMGEVSKALGEEPSPDEMRGPTREEIMEGLTVEGITVSELDVKETGTKTRVKMTVDFTSLEALSRVEGFGDDRKIDFYDEGGGKVRVVYSFDTTDLIPIDEVGEGGEGEDPVEKKIREVTLRARDAVKFRCKVTLPGALERSNGRPVKDDPKSSMWLIDKESSPEKHQTLGRGKLTFMMLIARDQLPFVTELKPLPQREGEKGGETPGGGGATPGKGGLGD